MRGRPTHLRFCSSQSRAGGRGPREGVRRQEAGPLHSPPAGSGPFPAPPPPSTLPALGEGAGVAAGGGGSRQHRQARHPEGSACCCPRPLPWAGPQGTERLRPPWAVDVGSEVVSPLPPSSPGRLCPPPQTRNRISDPEPWAEPRRGKQSSVLPGRGPRPADESLSWGWACGRVCLNAGFFSAMCTPLPEQFPPPESGGEGVAMETRRFRANQPACGGRGSPGLRATVGIIFNETRPPTSDYSRLVPLFQGEKNLPSVSAFLIS